MSDTLPELSRIGTAEPEGDGPAPSIRAPVQPLPIETPPSSKPFDVAIIGGGINGTGLARDLALRGLSVVLFERNDFAFGASGNSSGMIHGGVRYLSRNPSVTRDSCQDSGYIQAIAPHLLFRIPFIMPIRAGTKGRIMMELTDAYFGLYDRYQPLKRGKPHTRLTPRELASLEPGLVGATEGGITFDEWGVDGARLAILNAIDARTHGATLHVHTSVESMGRTEGSKDTAGYVLAARHMVTGERVRVHAKRVVNATGAWGPVTAALTKLPADRVRVRPGKGIHVMLDRRVSNYGILCEAVDGRHIFIMPWENMSTLGTTDDDYYGDLDDVVATSEEVRYLVQGVARHMPKVREARAVGTYAGVRPTLYEYGKNEDALSREHMIVDHAEDGAPGVYSMIGGKLASFRLFAQEMSDHLARDLAPGSTCTTHKRPLPGGERVPEALTLSEEHGITPVAARRLTYRHGAIAEEVLARIGRRPRERAIVCACEPVLEAEVRHAVTREMAETVDDVARRTRLGLGACGGLHCALRCGQIVAEERDLAPQDGILMAKHFLMNQARARIPAVGPEQAQSEALLLAHLHAQLGSDES